MPPHVGQWPGAAIGFSPYESNIAELVTRFGGTPERRGILVGFINLRSKLRTLGIYIDRQWIDGSFVEDVEASEKRPPGDVDVVTFFRRPSAARSRSAFSQLVQSNQDVFIPSNSKTTYKCDHYLVDHDAAPILDIEMVCYWHSLFSHKRDGAWKGYVWLADEGEAKDQQLKRDLIARGIT